MEKEEVLIKKYSNRRLYNANEARYVTLEEVADIIRQGHDIKVVDTKTKEDLTKQILAQIIMEEEKKQKDILPTSLFYKIIRSNQDFIRDFFENYLNYTIDAYISYRTAMQEKISEMEDVRKLPFEMGDIFMKSMGFMGPFTPFGRGEKK